MDSSSVSGIW